MIRSRERAQQLKACAAVWGTMATASERAPNAKAKGVPACTVTCSNEGDFSVAESGWNRELSLAPIGAGLFYF